MTPGDTYVSLNFDNPDLKKAMPWTGTHKGPQELFDVFGAIQCFWKTLDFKVADTIEQGNRVALFGSFTFKSVRTYAEPNLSPEEICAKGINGTEDPLREFREFFRHDLEAMQAHSG